MCVGYHLFLVEQSPEALLARGLRVVHLPVLCVHARDVGCVQYLYRAVMDYYVPRRYSYGQALRVVPRVRSQDREIRSPFDPDVRLLERKKSQQYIVTKFFFNQLFLLLVSFTNPQEPFYSTQVLLCNIYI